MTNSTPTPAELGTVATFPEQFFLENLAVRADGSILVSVLNRRQLWYVPAPVDQLPVAPVLVHTFASAPMGIAEAEADVFFVGTFGPATLERVDLRGWRPGAPPDVQRVLSFEPAGAVPNGCCWIGPRVLLVADSLGGRIWRVDLATDGMTGTAQVWLRHYSMAFDPDNPLNPQPGVNGLRYHTGDHHLYYTATTRKLFMRVPVDPHSRQPAGDPEIVAAGAMADDFCIDENAAVAYLTTHRENTIDRVALNPTPREANRVVVAGEPFTGELVGPSSIAWGRGPGDYGRLAYVTTDGGVTQPPSDNVIRPATLLRLQL